MGDVDVGEVEQGRLRAQHAPAVAVNGHHWNFVQAEAPGLGKFDNVFAQRVQVIATWVDDPHLLDLFLAEVVYGASNVLVDADLGKRTSGFGVVSLSPAPDLSSVDVAEVGSTTFRTFLSKISCISS